jgi:phosphopantetheinyl transferase
MLLKKLNTNSSIGYHSSGKPYLENSNAHISISHTKDYAGIIISDSFGVGLDLERIHPRIEKIAHKFVSPEEEKIIQGKNSLEKLFVIWGVKEVLFKVNSSSKNTLKFFRLTSAAMASLKLKFQKELFKKNIHCGTRWQVTFWLLGVWINECMHYFSTTNFFVATKSPV